MPAGELIQHKVTGEKLVSKVQEIIHEGNVRRVIIKNQDGMTVMEIPLTIGVASAVLMPVWVALGAIAALSAHYHITVEKVEGMPAEPEVKTPTEPVGAGTNVAEPW